MSRFLQSPLRISLTALFLLIGIELVAILVINHGMFTYVIDDAYIHLAFAQQLITGHFGINASEVSAPSSSILWPWILAPFSNTPIGLYIPLIFNILCAAGTLVVYSRILNIIPLENRPGIRTTILLISIPLTNLVGLVFTGMEHSAHLLMTILVLYGLIRLKREGTIGSWILAPLILGPLFRYEGIAVSGAAILYLFVRKEWKIGIVASLAILLSVGGFSFMLLQMGLGPLPTSVMAKSATAGGSVLSGIASSVREAFKHPRGTILTLLAVLFLIRSFIVRDEKPSTRFFWLALAIPVGLHLLFGSYGWYYRYEIYIWVWSIFGLLVLGGQQLSSAYDRFGPTRFSTAMVLVGIALSPIYWMLFAMTPVGANNIYEQQYQMHRFATEFYRKPVAVNDIGYVTYDNDQYVMDLVGLAYREAHDSVVADADPKWMDMLAERGRADLAMIYDDWFDRGVPENWIRLGELHLAHPNIVLGGDHVAFYARSRQAADEISRLIEPFRMSLPPGVTFIRQEEIGEQPGVRLPPSHPDD